MILRPEAQLQGHTPEALLDNILSAVPVPRTGPGSEDAVLTGSGKVAAVAGPLLLALGAATHWPELMALGVGCLLALAASLWWLLRRPDLIATREIARPGSGRASGRVAVLQLVNAGAHRSPPMLATERVGRRRVGCGCPAWPAVAPPP
jgi:hypothetical protein